MALVTSVTVIEIIFRFFILRPLVEGSFLPDKLSEMLLQRILPGQTSRDRDLLPAITKHWGIPLTDVKLSDGRKLWDTLINETFPKRNTFVHKAESIEEKTALCAIECANILIKDVLGQMSEKFGIRWKETGIWNKIEYKTENGIVGSKICIPSDPFK